MPNQVDLSDFVSGFLLEAEEHLLAVNRNLVATSEALTKGRPEPRAVRDLFRSLHTIKGISAMVGIEPIVDISHEMEGLLRTADKTGAMISENTLDLLVQGARAVEERVREVAQSGIKNVSAAPKKLIEALAAAQTMQSAPARAENTYDMNLPDDILHGLSPSEREQIVQAAQTSKRSILLEFEPSPERVAQGLNITSLRERLAKIGELIKVVPRSSATAPTGISFRLLLVTGASDAELKELVVDTKFSEIRTSTREVAVLNSPLPSDPLVDIDPVADWLPTEQSSIRVDVRRLDEALEQLSGLFVTRFKLERVAANMAEAGADIRELKMVIAENARQLRRLRTAISEARMVPVTELLQRLPLVVRGITRDSNKLVNVTIRSGTAEVDKAVADKIFPAVVHLIRNAVDHAIEPRDERLRSGKSETGEIVIACDDSSGTNLVITISDDGRGIDREAVALKAGRPIARTDEELFQQICIAGLSTASGVTTTSGRGMGMDIVKRTLEILGGSITLKTVVGKGTEITMRVPVTVTIVDVLSFVSGGQVFVTPVAFVNEIVEVDPVQSVLLPMPAAATIKPRLIQHRGKAIPLLVLESLLKNQGDSTIPLKALVVNHGSELLAFGIDRMLGKQEAVVRPLDDSLIRMVGMAGATDLGDGRPTLVLDLGLLGASAMQQIAVEV